jgi:hypothetical protein
MKRMWKRTIEQTPKATPRSNRWVLMAVLLGVLLMGQMSLAYAQSGIPIIDGILDFIDQYKLGIAMAGVAIIGLAALMRPLNPDMWNNHRNSLLYMIGGVVVLMMIPAIANLIVG